MEKFLITGIRFKKKGRLQNPPGAPSVLPPPPLDNIFLDLKANI
jgi:hypothetical protein